MSLIRARRRRKKTFIDVRGGMPVGRLVAFLIAVIALICYLAWRF